MQEFCAVEGDAVMVKKVPKPGEWIRRAGSDVKQGRRRSCRRESACCRRTPGSPLRSASGRCRSTARVRLGLFFTGDELVMPGEPLAAGQDLQLQSLHAERPGARRSAASVTRLRHRPGLPGGDARGAAASCGGVRPDRHLGRRLGRRRRLRQARGRGRGLAADVAHRDEARAAARVRQGRRLLRSSVCRAIRSRASSPS